MRRFFVIFLMLLLPLQSVWSAAATVCMHERSQAGERHFGHHEAHHADDESKSEIPDPLGLADTSDTDHHHALNVHPVSHAPSLAMPTIPAARHIPAVSDPYPSALIASLERPPKTVADIFRQRLGARA